MGAALPIIQVIGAAISIIGTVAGASNEAEGHRAQGQAAQQQATYNAAVARNNQIIADRKAADAKERGEIEAQRNELRTRQLIGQQRASAAARGVVVDEGSALDISANTAAVGAIDTTTIRRNAAREAMGFEAQAMNFEAEQGLRLQEGASAAAAGRTKATGSLISGATKVASKWHTISDKF